MPLESRSRGRLRIARRMTSHCEVREAVLVSEAVESHRDGADSAGVAFPTFDSNRSRQLHHAVGRQTPPGGIQASDEPLPMFDSFVDSFAGRLCDTSGDSVRRMRHKPNTGESD